MYVSLGEDRIVERVADITGKSPKTIYNYSSSGKWKDRLAEMEEEDKNLVAAFVGDSSKAKELLKSEVYKGMSQSLLETLHASLPLLQPTGNPRELKTILDMYRLLQGDPTEISRQEVTTINPDALTEDELETLAEDVIDRLFGESAEA